MKIQKLIIIILIVFFEATLFLTSESMAIPSFARRHKISCTTCHTPFPKLKPYGDEFAGDGFIMKEDEKERDYVTAGDDLLWLNRDFPLAVRFDAYAVFDQDHAVDKDLQIPWGLKLMSGGTLYKNIGYYFYFFMSERGKVAGIEDAYIHFDNIFGSDLDIMVGQFQTSDPLMKRELRLTIEDYMIYKQKFGHSATNLAYDRGLMFVYGVEPTSTDIVAMIVNGNGIAGDRGDGKFDSDPFKHFGLRVSQGVGDFLSFGGFYYQGKERLTSNGTAPSNKISYIGPDLNISVGPVEVTAQYLIRKDSNLLLNAEAKDVESSGTVVEVVLAPQLDRSRFLLTGLYNQIKSDLTEYNYQTATISATYLLSRNLRLIAEYTRDLENDLNRFSLGTVTAF
ncbi:MAG TPA: hypothetical protein ENN22_01685 [bacterium]|nr:hypothetical protein [bacterium]